MLNNAIRPVQLPSNQALQPTCNPPLRSGLHAAELGRYACGPSGLTFLVFSGQRHI